MGSQQARKLSDRAAKPVEKAIGWPSPTTSKRFPTPFGNRLPLTRIHFVQIVGALSITRIRFARRCGPGEANRARRVFQLTPCSPAQAWISSPTKSCSSLVFAVTSAPGIFQGKADSSSRFPCLLQRLLQDDLRSQLSIRGEMCVREHPANERQAQTALVAGASIRQSDSLFLCDARPVMADDEADEGR
jgi:hypothetical protein